LRHLYRGLDLEMCTLKCEDAFCLGDAIDLAGGVGAGCRQFGSGGVERNIEHLIGVSGEDLEALAHPYIP